MDENKAKGATLDAVGKVKDAAGGLAGNVTRSASASARAAYSRMPMLFRSPTVRCGRKPT